MSMPEEKRLRLNKLVDQIGQCAGVDFKEVVLPSKSIITLIGDNFSCLKDKAAKIAQFCVQDVAEYTNKGVVIFIDGCDPGKLTLNGVNHKEEFGYRLAYILCAQIAYREFFTNDEIGLVFNEIQFDDFIDGIFNFEESGHMYHRLISTQVLMISNVNKRIFEAKMAPDKVQERIAKISSSIDRLIDSRIKKNRPTIITVFDHFDNIFLGHSGAKTDSVKLDTEGCIGNTLKKLAEIVSEPKDVNEFSSEIVRRGCCRLCLAYTKDYSKFGSDTHSEGDFIKSLKACGINSVAIDTAAFKLKSVCENDLKNVRSEDVFSSLTKSLRIINSSCSDDGETVKAFFDSISKNPKMWCVLKGINNG